MTVKFLIFDMMLGKAREMSTWFPYFVNKLPDIEFITKPSEDFYIVLCPIQNFYLLSKNLNDHTILEKIESNSPKVIADLRNKKCGLMYIVEAETFGTLPILGFRSPIDVASLLDETTEFLKIEKNIISYCDNNYKISFALERRGYTGFWFGMYEVMSKPEMVKTIAQNIINKQPRNKKFLYLGGKPREFRLRFLHRLLQLPNFEQDSLITTGEGRFFDEVTKKAIYIPSRFLDYPDIASKNGLSQEEARSLNIDFHTSAYLNIVPMSYFYMNHSIIDVNEKLFKPIVAMQPFIVFGEPKLLKSLHELGYKTFSQWINEDYDLILNDEERLIFLVKEIERLNSLTYSEWTTMLAEMLPVLQHNVDLHRLKYESLHNEKLLLEKIKNKYNI